MKRVIKGENDLKTKAPEIAAEWDFEKNQRPIEEYAWKSNESVFWKCQKCGYSYKAKISNRAIGRGCPCCAGKTVVVGINDLATTHPQLASEWHPTKNSELTPKAVTFGRARKVWWLCPKGHEYQATINHRSGGTNCPICNSGRQTSFAEQAVFYYVKKIFPDAISRYNEIFENSMELDIYIPSIKLAIEYDGEAWHKADKHEREIKKYTICQKNGIKLLRLKEKMTDETRYTADECLGIEGNMYEHKQLEKVIRFLLDKIDPETNMWTRKNPRALHSSVDINIERDEMEIRSYMTDIKSGSLGELFPEIAKEWHPTKNGTLTPFEVFPYSDIKAYWKCPKCQKEYQATIGHRSAGTGCPKCGIKKSALAKSKQVQMVDLESQAVIRTFSSLTEASKKMNISSGNISAVCRGDGRKQAGGYFWRYCDTQQKNE